jgi:hypothetical protein
MLQELIVLERDPRFLTIRLKRSRFTLMNSAIHAF